MRSTRVLAAALLGITAPALAQPTWIKTACTPTNSHLNDVHFVTAQRGFIVGNNLVRLRTEDGGATWVTEQETGPGGEPWYGIVFHESGAAGFILGNSGGLRTTDGGATWEPMPAMPLGSWTDLDFAGSPTAVYAGSNGAIAFSPDAGTTWEVRSGYPNCPIIESMDFVTDDLGLVTGRRLEPNDSGMYRTVDGGRTWMRVFEDVARDVRWLSPTTAEASTYDGTIRSEDGGLTWTLVGFTNFPEGTAGSVDLGEGLLVAVTGLGEIHRSFDGGLSWSRVSGPLAELPDETWAITLTPDRKLWVVGKYGFILRSDDEGSTWMQVSSGMGLLMGDFEMFSDTLGMAAGGHGYLWRTTDGGRRWTVRKLIENPVQFGREEGLSTVEIVDEQFAIAAGGGGVMFRTWDGGETWESIGYPNLDGGLPIRDLCFIDRDNGWMLADGLYKTVSGGLVWEHVPGVFGEQVHFADAMRGWVRDGSSRVMRTLDGGQTWHIAGVPGFPLVLESMAWLDADTGWVVGRFGYCAKTTNGGGSWQLQNIGGQGVSMFDVAPVSAMEVWGVGYDDQYNNIILRSLNGGASWTRWTRSTGSETLDHIRRRPDGGLHIGGFFGLMLTDRFPRLCTGDWDASGAVDSGDISAFLTAWLASVQGGGLAADVDGDALVNSGDISAFLSAWLDAVQGGC